MPTESRAGPLGVSCADGKENVLIRQLKKRKVLAARSKEVAEIPLLKAANSRAFPSRSR